MRSGGHVFGVTLAIAAAAASAACGGSPHPTRSPTTAAARPPSAACEHDAHLLADDAVHILVHYGGETYPADVSFLSFRDTLAGFRSEGCPREALGRALARRMGQAERAKLLSHLPAAIARYVRDAVLAAGSTG